MSLLAVSGSLTRLAASCLLQVSRLLRSLSCRVWNGHHHSTSTTPPLLKLPTQRLQDTFKAEKTGLQRGGVWQRAVPQLSLRAEGEDKPA